MQKSEEKLTVGSKNDMRNLVNFNASSCKSENLQFDVVLLMSIAYKVSAKKSQKNILLWHWKKIQTLKKTDLLIEKWNEKFLKWMTWWTLKWLLESLKICTLKGHCCRKYVMFELKIQR